MLALGGSHPAGGRKGLQGQTSTHHKPGQERKVPEELRLPVEREEESQNGPPGANQGLRRVAHQGKLAHLEDTVDP